MVTAVEICLKMNFSELLPEPSRCRFLKYIGDLESGNLVEKIRRRDGKEIWAQINFFNTEWQGDEATFFAVADITELKVLEKMLKDRNELMMLINSILRHDILNDLTAILGLIEAYESLHDESILEKIKSRILDASKMIKRMKELEVLISEGGELKPVEVRSVVEEVKAKHDAEVRLMGNCRFMADDAIYSVFDNLIRNAINHGKSEIVEISCEQNEDFCEIRVADYGEGIPDEIKEKIFERGTRFGEGGVMGLGLYIVRKVIERYGGRVRVEDNYPKGTVFVLELKRAPC